MHDHMTHVVKIDSLTGHKKMGNLHFILKIIFHHIFIKQHAFSQTRTINYESIAYCLTEGSILISETMN